MKFGPLLFLCLLACTITARSQKSVLPVIDKARIESFIDSLPGLVSSGRVETSNHTCVLPDHVQYFIGPDRFGLSPGMLAVSGNRKKDAVNMYYLAATAAAFYNNKDYIQSAIDWNAALEIAISDHFSFEEMHILRPSLNNNYFMVGDYNGAMKISADGLSRSAQIRDTNRMAHFSNVIGYIHMKQKNFVLAEQYFRAELALSTAIRDTFVEGHAYYNLADLASAKQSYRKALDLLKQSAALYFSIRDTSYFKLAERKAFLLNKMTEVLLADKSYQEAISYANELIHLAGTHASFINLYDLASYYITAGKVQQAMARYDEALAYVRKGLSVALSVPHRESLRDAYELLSQIFSATKKMDSAYHYQLLFTALKDSIREESSQRDIMMREANLKIEQERIMQSVALEKQKRLRNIIIGAAIFSIILLLFFYNRYRLKQKNLYQEQLNRQRNELFNTIAVLQDQERKRFAQDIHDSLGAILSAARLRLSALGDKMETGDPAEYEKYKTALTLLDEASAELRNISHNIMPASLMKLGLVAALKNLCNTISSHAGLQISFSCFEFEERLEEQAEMTVYRIILELINNVVKHAEATKLTIQLIRYPGYLNITVEDDGRGFDFEKASQERKGIGLGNIQSRVEFLKGNLHVDSTPGRGTAVIIEIPLAG